MARMATGREFGKRLADALGFAGQPVTKIVVEASIDGPVKIYVCGIMQSDRVDGVLSAVEEAVAAGATEVCHVESVSVADDATVVYQGAEQ